MNEVLEQIGQWSILQAPDGHRFARHSDGVEDHPVCNIYPDGTLDIFWEDSEAVPKRVHAAFKR